MKFYEIDLTQIIPYGIPLNSESHVEYSDYINEFFLRGFQNWFNRLYTVEDSDLIRDYSRSCTAPYSLDACKFCSDSQLQTMITEAGFIYYSNNAHDINAKFVYDLAKYPFGTEAYLTTIAQYVANSGDVYAEAIYNDEMPFTYAIHIYGDITDSANVGTMSARMIENLKILGTAHTQVTDFQFEDSDSEVAAYVGCVADDVRLNLEFTISEPVDDNTIKNILKNSSYYRDVTLNNSSLRGCPRTQFSRLSANYYNFENTIVRFHLSGNGGTPYPMVGYQDYRRLSYNSRYIVNDQDIPAQILSSDKMTRMMYLSESKMNEYGLSDFKKETLYNNLGMRKQVFSFRQAGFKKYIDADEYVTNPNNFNIMVEGSLQNYAPLGYFKDQHFMGYLSADGKSLATFGGSGNVYKVGYKLGASDIYKFLMDDAYDYVVDMIHGCDDLTHVPTLGSVTDGKLYNKLNDVNGDPIDYQNSFTFGFDSHHHLTIECSQVIENAVWVQFHLVRKPNYLEGWTTVATNSGSCNPSGTTTLGFYKCYSSTLQPGGVVEGDPESDYGTGFEPVCYYAGTNPTPNARYFRHITEAMAFAGYANLATYFSYQTNNNNLQHEVRSHVQRIWGPVSNGGALYVVGRFSSINSADITVEWNNPRKNREYSVPITNELAFGISKGYDGCKIYVVDEVNHDSSLANKLKTSLVWNAYQSGYDLVFKYTSDDSLEAITHIKVHPSFHEE